MQEGYAQVEKTVKKEDLDIDRTPNNSLYFHLANAAVLQQLLHMDTMQRLSALALHF